MDINQMSPKSGRVIKEDNTVVNMADLAHGNDVVFHNSATVAANGNVFAVGGFKYLTIEIYGTSVSRTVMFYGKSKSGTLRALAGIKLSDFSIATSTSANNEIWQFDITGLDYVVMDLSAVSGGNVSVKGRAVA